MDQAGSPTAHAAAGTWPFEDWELQRDFDGQVARLMGDYQSSHDLGYEYESWGEESGRYRYRYYETPAEAASAAARYRAAARHARAAISEAGATEGSVSEQLDQARAGILRTWPWQRHTRARLLAQIGDAEMELHWLAGKIEHKELEAEWQDRLRADAESQVPVLRRRDRAWAAAAGAVTRTLGWAPGDTPPGRPAVFQAGPDGIDAQHASAEVTGARPTAGTAQMRAGSCGIPAAAQVMVPPCQDGRPGTPGPRP